MNSQLMHHSCRFKILYHTILEHELARITPAHAEFIELLCSAEARGITLDDEGCDAF